MDIKHLLKKKEKEKKPNVILINHLQRRKDMRKQRKEQLKKLITKAGIETKNKKLKKIMTIIAVILNIILTSYVISRYAEQLSGNISYGIVMFIILWVLLFGLILFAVWLTFYLSIDLAIFKRKQKVEEVLPDFLQLASSNVRAGMNIDQALFYAVRPRFGVLCKEIEEVAKRSYAGEPLDVALKRFADRYDSPTLTRSINLLCEGLQSGGEIGKLLNKIATNIQETQIMKKEMSANVTTYVIFISFATVFAAPLLYGMAYHLIRVIQDIFSKIDIDPSTAAGMTISVGSGSVVPSDFKIFAIACLLISSFFSAMIISTIKKGSVKAGVKYIPMFMIASTLLFFIVIKLFGVLVSGFF